MISFVYVYDFFNKILLGVESVEGVLWEVIGFPLIIVLGLYLTVRSRCIQLRGWRALPRLLKRLAASEGRESDEKVGLSPLRLFFANVGGAVGVGNVVGICLAVQLGGPGAIFWVWMVALVGVVLKYCEVYLGMRYRVRSAKGYEGGPMYYLPQAAKTLEKSFPRLATYLSKMLPKAMALFLCVYGVEIYQFHVMVDSVTISWALPKIPTALFMLSIVLWAARGGFKLVGQLAEKMIPLLICLYLVMSSGVLIYHIHKIPALLVLIFKSAFSGHAATGGFLGATFFKCMQQGIARGCYASDIGIGYTSMIHAESSETSPQKQASLTFIGVLIDVLGICTLSILMVLVTGMWKEPIDSALMVQSALSTLFPKVHLFMPVMIFLLGYSTVITFFAVGLKSAQYLSPQYGKTFFFPLGGLSLLIFSFFDSRFAMSVMSVCGGVLLVINLLAFWLLREQIHFGLGFDEEIPEKN